MSILRDQDPGGLSSQPGTRLFIVAMVLGMWSSGCAVHKQVQYFAATNPETGITNYYRMTVSGGGIATDFHLQAGYFSAAAVDILRGSMPNVPILDMSLQEEERFQRLAKLFHANIHQKAKEIAPITDPEVCYNMAKDIRDVLLKNQHKAKYAKETIEKKQVSNNQALQPARAERKKAIDEHIKAQGKEAKTEADLALKAVKVGEARASFEIAEARVEKLEKERKDLAKSLSDVVFEIERLA